MFEYQSIAQALPRWEDEDRILRGDLTALEYRKHLEILVNDIELLINMSRQDLKEVKQIQHALINLLKRK